MKEDKMGKKRKLVERERKRERKEVRERVDATIQRETQVW